MKKAIVLVCALALVATASANIELFLKDGGVSSFVFDGTARNYLPYFDHGVGAVVPAGQNIQTTGTLDRTFFLWGKFVNEAPGSAKIIGIAPNITFGSVGTLPPDLNIHMADNVIYRHRKTNGTTSQKWTRWDGSANIGIQGPAAAVTNAGIVNDATLAYDLVADYGSPDGEAAFLLGAFRVVSTAGLPSIQKILGTINLGLGSLGLAANDGNRSYYPEVDVNGVVVQERWYNDDPGIGMPGTPVTHPGPAAVIYSPEPASMLLIGLGLLLRRR
jgi:hypothetical protein